MTSTSMSASAFCTRPTAFSLPGMVREEKITQSPSSSFTLGCSFCAMRAMAARVSPWLPVHSASTLWGGSLEKIVSSWKERSGSR